MTVEEVHTMFEEVVAPVVNVAMQLTPAEADNLGRFRIDILGRAMRNTRKWIAKRKEDLNISITHHASIYRSILQSAEYNTQKESAKEAEKSHSKNVELVLSSFQANCTDGTWTILDSAAEQLLEAFGVKAVREAMLSIGIFEPENTQSALDLLHHRLAMQAIQV